MVSAGVDPISTALPGALAVNRQTVKPVSMSESPQVSSTWAVLMPSDAWRSAGTVGEPLNVVTDPVGELPLVQPLAPSARTRK